VNQKYFTPEENSFIVGDTPPVHFIGGSTMAGKGISGIPYPATFSKKASQSVNVYTRYLIGLSEVVELVKLRELKGDLYVNCGAGDEMRVLSPSLRRLLPDHWFLPAHLDAPVHLSRSWSKRTKQIVVNYIKYMTKIIAAFLGLYRSVTDRSDYENLMSEFADIAQLQNLKIYWIESPAGNFMIPRFIRQEKRDYCKTIFLKNLSRFPEGSRFVAIDREILSKDLLDDGFHLNQRGHDKLASILLEASF